MSLHGNVGGGEAQTAAWTAAALYELIRNECDYQVGLTLLALTALKIALAHTSVRRWTALCISPATGRLAPCTSTLCSVGTATPTSQQTPSRRRRARFGASGRPAANFETCACRWMGNGAFVTRCALMLLVAQSPPELSVPRHSALSCRSAAKRVCAQKRSGVNCVRTKSTTVRCTAPRATASSAGDFWCVRVVLRELGVMCSVSAQSISMPATTATFSTSRAAPSCHTNDRCQKCAQFVQCMCTR